MSVSLKNYPFISAIFISCFFILLIFLILLIFMIVNHELKRKKIDKEIWNYFISIGNTWNIGFYR